VDLVSTQSDVASLVAALRRGRNDPGVRTLNGWRRELVGAELVKLLEGQCAVRVQDGRLTVEPND
jgi:ribonuclease D